MVYTSLLFRHGIEIADKIVSLVTDRQRKSFNGSNLDINKFIAYYANEIYLFNQIEINENLIEDLKQTINNPNYQTKFKISKQIVIKHLKEQVKTPEFKLKILDELSKVHYEQSIK
jgi:hypothetical protein